MPTDELAYADIAEIAPQIRAGEITATQLTESWHRRPPLGLAG
jgi:hypothetical protein